MRTILIWVAAAFVFGNFYIMVAQQEALRRNGLTVYLVLVPVDPRSNTGQGDYLELNYEITNQIGNDRYDSTQPKHPDSGAVVIRLNEQNIGTFVRYDQGGPLAPGEHLLKYHYLDWHAAIGAESYFIPEGTAASFDHAVYGELKLQPDGTAVLVALCDKDRNPISAAGAGSAPPK